jgi:hypothetical protein
MKSETNIVLRSITLHSQNSHHTSSRYNYRPTAPLNYTYLAPKSASSSALLGVLQQGSPSISAVYIRLSQSFSLMTCTIDRHSDTSDARIRLYRSLGL